MKKLIAISSLALLAGCATPHCPKQTVINGQAIYVGMSQEKLEQVLGPPLESENKVWTINNKNYYGLGYKYADHNIAIKDGAVVGICEAGSSL